MCQGRTDRVGEGMETPPTTRKTKARGAIGGDKGTTRGPGIESPISPQQGTVADRDSAETHYRHTDSARPKQGALAPQVRLTGAIGSGG